jgi:hypothetical protein
LIGEVYRDKQCPGDDEERQSSRDADAVERACKVFQHISQKSTHGNTRELQIPRSTVHKVLHSGLKLHVYKIQMVQALQPDDGPHQDFAMEMLDHTSNDTGFLDNHFL